MAAYDSLVTFVSNQANRRLVVWRQLMNQCEAARAKLTQLKQYAERYRVQMRADLQQGMAANATMVFLSFIGQIESVIAKQELDVTRLEQACLQQWRHLVEARREKRMFEILRDRAAAEKLAAALQKSQAEIDELFGRIVKLL
jgi:flagellar export protein FliJ